MIKLDVMRMSDRVFGAKSVFEINRIPTQMKYFVFKRFDFFQKLANTGISYHVRLMLQKVSHRSL